MQHLSHTFPALVLCCGLMTDENMNMEKTIEVVNADANRAWMPYENEIGDDWIAFRDAIVAEFLPLLEAERAKVAALQAKKFMSVLDARTVKGAPDKVPMEILSNSHAEKQHGGQSLDRLNARGGLSCLEIVANLRRVSPSSILAKVSDEMAVIEIKEAIKAHNID